MASRYPTIKAVDYCFNPIHVVDKELDKDIIVPCGKCDGCLLHKANEWSMRCGMEIEDSPATIFTTLTYDNKYLPKLYPLIDVSEDCPESRITWFSDHKENVRFDSVKDVLREDHIVITHDRMRKNYYPIDIKNWDNVSRPSINYASKRDIQLYLKLLRKDLFDHGFIRDEKRGFFRYYVISEVGPTTFRGHFHLLFFCSSNEIASFLLESGLYKNWQMCDEVRFRKYTHLCDSGARGYVTQYLTQYSRLPEVYRENKEIRPFRLASKSPAIGYIGQDAQKVFEDVGRGVIHYSRPVYRLESNSLLLYPSGFLSSLFPKCYRFNKTDDSRRFYIYRYLYAQVRENGRFPSVLLPRLSKIMHSQDVLATSACYRFCCEFVDSPEYYYYLLDTYYYKLAMERLKNFYMAQQNVDFSVHPELIFEFYPNIEVLCNSPVSRSVNAALYGCLSPLGFDYVRLLHNEDFFRSVRIDLKNRNASYYNEVRDIISNMEKMSKYNELTGTAPTIV